MYKSGFYFVAVQGVKMRSCKMAEGRELSSLVYIILLYKGKHDAILSVTFSVGSHARITLPLTAGSWGRQSRLLVLPYFLAVRKRGDRGAFYTPPAISRVPGCCQLGTWW